jgi:hypothetical protein
MPNTAKLSGTISVAGLSFPTVVSRSAEGQIGQIIPLPAGKAGAMTAGSLGVDGLPTGHGLVHNDVIDIHWVNPTGIPQCHRGVVVETPPGVNAITFDVGVAGEGDALPAEDTDVVVSKQVVVDVAFDADSAKFMAARCNVNAMVNFRDDSHVSHLARLLTGNEAWAWADGGSEANPLLGDTIETIHCSNASSVTAGTLHIGVLYDSTE